MSDTWSTEFEAELAALNEQQELKLVAAFRDFAEAYVKPELLMLDLIRETVQKEVDTMEGATETVLTEEEEQAPVAAAVDVVAAATQLGGKAPVSEVVKAVGTIGRTSGGTTPTNQQVGAASGRASASGSSRGERGGRWGRGGRRGSTSRRPPRREMMVTDEWVTESTTAPAPQLPNYATSPVVYFNPRNL